MAYTKVTRLPDRFLAEFWLLEGGNFQDWIDDQVKLPFDRVVVRHRMTQVPIAQEDFEFDGTDVERDAHVQRNFSPKSDPQFLRASWVVAGYAAYVDTYDTPSGNLEPGCMWEGPRKRALQRGAARAVVDLVVWKDESGALHEGQPAELTVTRSGQTVEKITRKSR